MSKPKKNNKIEKSVSIKNRKASFEYEFLDVLQAGIVLRGTEIKSIRQSKVNMQEAYCLFIDGELWLRGMSIAEYDKGNIHNHDPKSDRKLLLKKRELGRLEKKLKDVGLTIVPTKIYINARGFAKVNVALAKGKKLHDKRQSIKEKESKRSLREI